MGALLANESPETSRVSFATNLEAWGARVAVIADGDRKVSYDELARLADEFATRLPESVRLIAIEASNTLESVAAYLGALRRGVPIIKFAGGGVASDLLARFKPDAIFGRSSHAEGWILTLQPRTRRPAPHPDLALALSTSGSTGEPKLVRLSAANLQANAESIAEFLGLTKAERAITTLPLSYSYGLSVLNSHLAVGASVVLTDQSVSSPDFRETIVRHRVTSLAGVPYTYDLLERCGLLENLPPSLRTLTQAGGRMAPEMVRRAQAAAARIGARLIVMYGQTEATARIAYLSPDQLKAHPDCIGQAIPGGELWIQDAAGDRLPPGREGEVVYRGPNVMMGYASSPQDLAEPRGPDVLRTGDIGLEVEPGVFRITGRLSRFVKPFGLRIGLDELERRCSEEGAVARVAGDDSLVVVAVETDAALDAARRAVGALNLPVGLVEYRVEQAMPTLAGGKPDYPEILRRGHDARRGSAGVATGLQDLDAVILRLLGARKPQDSDTFQTLGGDSLSYVQFSIALEEALGYLPEHWEETTIRELRAMVRRAGVDKAPSKMATLESDVVVRCLAILVIVTQHAVGGLQGGADVLMMLSGFSWARFQRQPLLNGRQWAVFRNFAVRYTLIYVMIMVAAAVLKRSVNIPHLLFFSTFIGNWGGVLNIYWFIESLTWIALLVCAACSIGPIRDLIKSKPVTSALGFVALALALRVFGESVTDARSHVFRSPDQMLIYFAIGWAMVSTQRPMQLLLVMLACAVSALGWGWKDTHAPIMAMAGLTMVMFPRIPLPRVLMGPVVLVAAASFYIYIFNVFPMQYLEVVLKAPLGAYWLPNIVASITIGICAYLVAGRLQGRYQRWRERFSNSAQAA